MHPALTNKLFQNAAGLFIIIVLVVFCAWPAMRSPLFTDDIAQIEYNTAFTKWTQIFGPDAFNFFRPVKNAIFHIAAPLKDNLLAWHCIGLAAYLAATAGVYRIAFICLGTPRPAWLATFIWALSPTCVSTAIWLSCANISVGIAFAACVFHFHERWAARPSIIAAIACAALFAMALLSYESMIALPALLFFRDLQQRRIGIDRRTIFRYGVYFIVVLMFLYIRHIYSAKSLDITHFHPGWAPETQRIHLTLSAPWFLWRHFLMWIFPFGNLEVFGSYRWLYSASAMALVLAWFSLAALLFCIVALWKRYPVIGYGILFFIVAMFPAGNFIPTFNGPIHDLYVTIPSIGLALAFASGCELLFREFAKRRRHAEQGCFVLATLLGIILFYRMVVCGTYFLYWANVWKKPVEMMLLVSEARPYQFQAKALASYYLLKEGYLEQAKITADSALEEAPWNITARITLAQVATYGKDYKTAEQYYRFVINAPNVTLSSQQIALLELAKIISNDPTKMEETAELLRQYLRSNGAYPRPEAVAMLAKAYQDLGDSAKARATLERGLNMAPNDKKLASMLEAMNNPSSKPESNSN